VTVSTELLGVVEDALEEYLKQPSSSDADFAARHRALPLYAGWTGTTYLTASGEFWFRNCEYAPPRIENDLNDSSKIVALVVATERYPQLARLLPKRPDLAIECDACGGRGQITVGNLSNIICGECSGLGWREAAGAQPRAQPPYPSFDEALGRLRSFAHQYGFSTDLVFITAEHALLVRDRLYLTAEGLHLTDDARTAYEHAVACYLGVALGAVGELPNRKLAFFIYGPSTQNEAERLMYPKGLKLTAPECAVAVRCISKPKLWLLRFAHRRHGVARTREHLR
jgi:hypothetical protein